MPKVSKSEKKEERKISYNIPEEAFTNLAFYTASLPKSPTPGPYMRDLALEESKKGAKLRERLAAKAR